MVQVKTIPLFTAPKTAAQSEDGGYARKKAIADMLMSGQPQRVWSNGEGMLSAASTIMGGLLAKRAEEDKTASEDNAWKELTRAMTGASGLGDAPTPSGFSSTETSGQSPQYSDASAPAGGRSGGGSRSMASNERKSRMIGRLVEKGYSQHAAEGIADNIGHESAYNPLAVGDNGTAYGIAQWRGPRFQNLKKYAANTGRNWQDFDVQTDFIDHEMKNNLDEGAGIAYAKLQDAPDADSAYNAFVSHYERPSAANLRARLRPLAQYGRGQSDADTLPPLDISIWQQQAKQGAAMMASSNPLIRRQGLLMLQQAQAQAAEARQSYSMKQFDYARDRANKREQADLTREGYDRQDARSEREIIARAEQERLKREAEFRNVPPGTSVLDHTGKVIYTAPPAQQTNGLKIGADGSIEVGPGFNLKEQQSKDIGFYERGASAEMELMEREDALTDFMSKNAGDLPAIGNYMKSPEYRQAEVVGKNFLAGILRKDSGGAITKEEWRDYGGMFLPQPGDDAETIRLKRQARHTALNAIRKGLGSAEALAKAFPTDFDGKSLEPLKGDERNQKKYPNAPKIGTVMDGHNYLGGDPADPKSWEKRK